MAQQNDINNQDDLKASSADDEIIKKMTGVFEEEDNEGEADPVTKIYVAGNEYNSVDEIPPDVRDKMSETLLQVHQESSNAEDLSMAFKKQRKLRTSRMLFGDRADNYTSPPINFGKIALVIVAVVAVALTIYILLAK